MAIVNLGYKLEDQTAGFTPLPAGNYACKIESAEVGTSQNGNNMIKLKLIVLDGEFAGRKLFDNIMLMQESAFKMKQYAEVIGIESGEEIDTQDFMNRECIVLLGQREYNGQLQNDIKKVSPVTA